MKFGIYCLVTLLLTSVMSFAIESPSYTVKQKDGDFEVRVYPEMVAAATSSGNQNSGFRTLFRFISGNNEGEQKIAMTSPVFMPADAKGNTKEMMFLVPKSVVTAGVPDPKSEAVSIKKIAGGKFAVVRAPGRMDDNLRKEMLNKLNAKIAELGLQTVGGPMYAGYDAPWVAAAKRRNEVLVRLK